MLNEPAVLAESAFNDIDVIRLIKVATRAADQQNAAWCKCELARHSYPDRTLMSCQFSDFLPCEFQRVIRRQVRPHEDVSLRRAIGLSSGPDVVRVYLLRKC